MLAIHSTITQILSVINNNEKQQYCSKALETFQLLMASK